MIEVFIQSITMHFTIWIPFGVVIQLIYSIVAVYVSSEESGEEKSEAGKVNEHFRLPPHTRGLLYPQDSETRELHTLDGIWKMVKASSARPKEGYQQKWYEKGIIHSGRKVLSMAVPASYNDITVSQSLRYHVGAVWYERNFFVPGSWGRRRRTWLRFGSVHYKAEVWINGEPAMSHNSGSLPFEMEVGNYVNFGATNRLTVMCDNRQGGYTIPQGNNHEAEGNRTKERYTFEMYNAGIYRSVHLYSTPRIYISDIDVDTEYFSSEQLGVVRYRLFLDGDFYGKSRNRAYYIHVQLQNQESQVVAAQINRHPFRGSLQVHNVRAWWPFLMNPQPGYLYRLQVELHKGAYKGEESIDDEILDIYRLPVGIRSLMWSNDSLLLNGKNLYLRGFGRHEDFEVRDLPKYINWLN